MNNIKFTPPHVLSGMAENTPILLALSGGADSSALFFMLLDYCKKHGTPLYAAHVNHMIRGEDADRDSEFCKRLAEKYGITLFVKKADVPALAAANKRGLEEEARAVRYGFFEQLMSEHSIPLLATAHNATDNAETIIFNLTRGSGLHGLCGIPQIRTIKNGLAIRPILDMSKAEILNYCAENNIDYVSDCTNTDTDYSRNRIRCNILPELEKINSAVISNISRASKSLRLEDSFMLNEARAFTDSLASPHSAPLALLQKMEHAMLYRVLNEMSKKLFTPEAVHLDAMAGLVKKGVAHSSADMPCGCRAVIENGFFAVEAKSKKSAQGYLIKVALGITEIPEADAVLIAEKADITQNSEENHNLWKNIYKKSTTTLISFDTICKGLYARNKQDGDKIVCNGMSKKIKKLFCEKELTLFERATLPLICDSEGVVWIPDIALCDREKNCKETKVRLTLYRQKINQG